MKQTTNREEFSIAFVWSPIIALSHFIQIPKLLILHQADMSITSSELNIIITVHYYKWTRTHPFVSAKTLSDHIGLSEHAVRTNINRLVKKGYLRKVSRGPRTSNAYDFTPLIRKLESYPQIPTKSNPQGIQNQIPTYIKMNSTSYTNMNTELYEDKKKSLSRRFRPSGKPESIANIMKITHGW